MHAILSFSSPRYVIIACQNVIYAKFRHVMIAQLNKIWHMWACAHAIACHSWLDLVCYKVNDAKTFKNLANHHVYYRLVYLTGVFKIIAIDI